jgi:hypothetical protein
MGYIEGYNLTTIVGQPTAGTNGDINIFILPDICGKDDPGNQRWE